MEKINTCPLRKVYLYIATLYYSVKYSVIGALLFIVIDHTLAEVTTEVTTAAFSHFQMSKLILVDITFKQTDIKHKHPVPNCKIVNNYFRRCFDFQTVPSVTHAQ